jgi:hypothetical protein
MELGPAKSTTVFVTMIPLLATSQLGSAEESPVPAPPVPATIQCEAPGGHFRQYDFPAGGDKFRVSGRIKLLTTDYAENWLPGARLAITGRNEGIEKTRWAGLEIVVPPEQFRNQFQIGVVVSQKEPEAPPVIQSTLRLNEDNARYTLTYDHGNMTVNVNGTERSFVFNVPDPVVWVHCSSGSFEFTDIQIDALHEPTEGPLPSQGKTSSPATPPP